MLSKEEIKKWLLENCVDKDGNLDLRYLDFSDFNGNVYTSGMKVKNSLLQDCQEVKRNLWQDSQCVQGDLAQNYQEVKGTLKQDFQEVQGDLFQDEQDVKGKIIQDKLTDADIPF